MAKKSTKRINSNNSRIIRINITILLISNILPLLFLLYTHKYRHTCLLKTIPEFLSFYFLYSTSKPKNRITHGTDLKSRGLISLVFDFLYLNMLVRLLSYYTMWAYLFVLLIIVCAWYEFSYRVKRK